jgi:hypothetical protein
MQKYNKIWHLKITLPTFSFYWKFPDIMQNQVCLNHNPRENLSSHSARKVQIFWHSPNPWPFSQNSLRQD